MNKYSCAVMLIVLTTCAQNIQGAASSKPIKRRLAPTLQQTSFSCPSIVMHAHMMAEELAPIPKRMPSSCPSILIRAHIKNLLSMEKNHPAFASAQTFEKAGFILPSCTIEQMRPEIALECHLYTKAAGRTISEGIKGKMQTMPAWLKQDLAGVSIHDLIEHDMLPDIDKNGELNLSAQYISDLRGIEHLPSPDKIKILKLGSNRISAIGERAFQALPNLEELWLRVNLITRIHSKAFAGQIHLKRIDLSCNTIKAIRPGTFANLPELISLRLTKITGEELAQIRAETTAKVIA